jgi:hypothetical protein
MGTGLADLVEQKPLTVPRDDVVDAAQTGWEESHRGSEVHLPFLGSVADRHSHQAVVESKRRTAPARRAAIALAIHRQRKPESVRPVRETVGRKSPRGPIGSSSMRTPSVDEAATGARSLPAARPTSPTCLRA